MVNSLDLSTIIAQIPQAQRLHHTQYAHPEIQQALAQELVLKRQKESQKQIGKAESPVAESAVDKDGQGGGGLLAHDDGKHSSFEAPEQGEEGEQGRLLDVRV